MRRGGACRAAQQPTHALYCRTTRLARPPTPHLHTLVEDGVAGVAGRVGVGGHLCRRWPPAPAELGPSLLDLGALDPAAPARFYLPDPSFEALSDCYAVVQGVRLPLHGQLLAARAAVLRQLFVAQTEEGAGAGPVGSHEVGSGCGETPRRGSQVVGGPPAAPRLPIAASDTSTPGHPPQAPAELSSAFAGCGLTEVATFLRLTYSPDQATPGSLAAVHRCGAVPLRATLSSLRPPRARRLAVPHSLPCSCPRPSPLQACQGTAGVGGGASAPAGRRGAAGPHRGIPAE